MRKGEGSGWMTPNGPMDEVTKSKLRTGGATLVWRKRVRTVQEDDEEWFRCAWANALGVRGQTRPKSELMLWGYLL